MKPLLYLSLSVFHYIYHNIGNTIRIRPILVEIALQTELPTEIWVIFLPAQVWTGCKYCCIFWERLGTYNFSKRPPVVTFWAHSLTLTRTKGAQNIRLYNNIVLYTNIGCSISTKQTYTHIP